MATQSDLPALKAGGSREETPKPARSATSTRQRRRQWAGAVIVAVLLLALDVSQPPQRQASAWILVGAINIYQATLSKLMPVAGVQCRFQPTCSHYAEGSIRKHGTLVGTAKAGRRLLRCGPWTELGTLDPP